MLLKINCQSRVQFEAQIYSCFIIYRMCHVLSHVQLLVTP